MTITPNPTPEGTVANVLNMLPDGKRRYHHGSAHVVNVLCALRAAGLLVEAPTEEQIEQTAAAEAEERWWNGGYKARYLDQSPAKSWQNGFIDGAKWAAAGVTVVEASVPTSMRRFHGPVPGMPNLWHTSCADHPGFGTCAEEEARRDIEEHLAAEHAALTAGELGALKHSCAQN